MISLHVLCLVALLGAASARLPDKVFCADEKCSNPISKAKTILKFNSGDPDLISFPAGADVVVYRKSAGTNADLWMVEVGGRTGFVPSKFLREYKMFVKKPSYISIVETRSDQGVPIETPSVQPDKVLQPHEVLDGTTIYSSSGTTEPSNSESTEIPVQDKSTPPLTGETSTKTASPSENRDNSRGVPDETVTESTPINVNIPPAQDIPPTVSYEASHESVNNQNIEQPSENNLNSEGLSEPLKSIENKPNSEKLNAGQDAIDKIDHNEVQNAAPENNERTQLTENTEPSNINTAPISENGPNQAQPDPSAETEVPAPVALPTAELPVLQNLPNHPSAINYLVSEIPVQQPPFTTNIDLQDKPADSVSKHYSPTDEEEPFDTDEQDQEGEYDEEEDLEDIEDGDEPPTGEFSSRTPEKNVQPVNDPPKVTETLKEDLKDPNPVYQQYQNQLQSILNSIQLGTIPPDQPGKEPLEIYSPGRPDNQPDVSTSTESPVQTNDIIPSVSEQGINQATDKPLNEPEIPKDQPDVTPYTESPIQTNDLNPSVTEEDVNNATKKSLNEPERPEHQPEVNPSTESTLQTNDSRPSVTDDDLNNATEKSLSEQEIMPSLAEKPTGLDPIEIERSSVSPSEINAPMESNTETPTEGMFSGLYTTVSSLWPSATESPETIAFPEEKMESVFSPNHMNENTFENVPERSEKLKEATVTNVDEKNDGFSILVYISSLFNSVMPTTEETKALFAAPGERCLPEEYGELNKTPSNRLFIFLAVTATSVLIFTLGYYYIDIKRQDGRLVAMVNTLQRDLLCTTKECEILKDELMSTKGKLAGIEDNSFGMDEMVQSLKAEIEEWKRQNEKLRNSLDDNEKLLRISENTASELQNTLSDLENTLGELLNERASSEDHAAELNEKAQAFEEELISVSRERDAYQLKFVSSEKAVEELKKLPKQVEELNTKLKEANSTIELLQHEIVALKDLLKQVKSGSITSAEVSTLIDQSEVKAKLTKALEEKTAFERKFEWEHGERTRLQEELAKAEESLASTQQRSTEFSTRLDVLDKYFKERESDLRKELSTKEAFWLSKQGESISTVEKIESLQQEVHQYKGMYETTRRELAEQEADRRAKVAELEASAHSAWLEARAARRDAQADREEAAALRRKMASMANSPPPGSGDIAPSPHQRVSSPLDVSVDGGIPPPLPPLAFLPPPLLPPLPRPPPLGRLPSPHPPPRYGERRYSPEHRYSPESRYSPETMRYSPDSRYSPDRSRRSPYLRYSRERYYDEHSPPRQRNSPPRQRSSPPRHRNGHPATETENDYSPPRSPPPPRRRGYAKRSGPSSGSGCSSESNDK